MQTVKRKWTLKEVQAFSEWEQKRKSGELGAPVSFNNVDALVSWLHAAK